MRLTDHIAKIAFLAYPLAAEVGMAGRMHPVQSKGKTCISWVMTLYLQRTRTFPKTFNGKPRYRNKLFRSLVLSSVGRVAFFSLLSRFGDAASSKAISKSTQ